jgi:hypothetical protein
MACLFPFKNDILRVVVSVAEGLYSPQKALDSISSITHSHKRIKTTAFVLHFNVAELSFSLYNLLCVCIVFKKVKNAFLI